MGEKVNKEVAKFIDDHKRKIREKEKLLNDFVKKSNSKQDSWKLEKRALLTEIERLKNALKKYQVLLQNQDENISKAQLPTTNSDEVVLFDDNKENILNSQDNLKGNEPLTSKTLLDGVLVFFIDRAQGLHAPSQSQKDRTVLENLFVSGRIGPTILFKTRVMKNAENPIWEKKCKNTLCHEAENVTINVRNLINDLGGSSDIASVQFPCSDIIKGNRIEGWFDLTNDGKQNGRIKMSLEYHSKEELEIIKQNTLNSEISSDSGISSQDDKVERKSLFRLDSMFEQECDDNLTAFAERFTSSFPSLKRLPSPDPFVSLIKTYPSHKFFIPRDHENL